MNKESTLYVVIFSLVITFILVLPLTVANVLTKDLVEQNKQVASALSILKSMGLPADKADPKAVLASYDGLEKFKLEKEKLVAVTTAQVRAAEKSGFPLQPLFYRGKGPAGTVWGGAFTGPDL